MIYTVAPDWSTAWLQCRECGVRYGAEMSEEEAHELRPKAFGIVMPSTMKLRKLLKRQLETQLRQLGCPHVGP